MLDRYHAIGCMNAQIAVETKFTNESGVVDLVYKIEGEGDTYVLDELKIE